MKAKQIIFCLSACVALLLSGCQSSPQSLGSGVLQVPSYTVAAPAAGQLIGLITEKGERISKEQPLFAIADPVTDKQVKDSAAELAKAEAELKRMEKSRTEAAPAFDVTELRDAAAAAQQKAEKMQSLLTQGAVSRKMAQAAQEEALQAEAALQAARESVLSTRPATAEEIEAQKKIVDQLTLLQASLLKKQQENEAVSPCTGVVTEILAANNTQVCKGQPVLTLQATESCSLRLTVTAKQAEALHREQSVILKAGDTAFTGQIAAIDGATLTITSEHKPEAVQAGAQVEVSLASPAAK